MNHLDTLINQATDGQKARARAIAGNFAAHSGLQSHTCPDGFLLALANIVDTDLHPVPATATRPASLDGYIPCYTVPLQADNDAPHACDIAALLAWAQSWPESVTLVRLIAPRIGESIVGDRRELIAQLA